MKIKSIIARFLPLLDVAIVLLGLMVVLMSYAHYENKNEATKNETELEKQSQNDDAAHQKDKELDDSSQETSSRKDDAQDIERHVELVLLHAADDGKCYRIEAGTNVRDEISTDDDKDIRPILDRSPEKAKLILLVSRSGEIDTLWPGDRVDRLEKNWNLKGNEILCRLPSVPF